MVAQKIASAARALPPGTVEPVASLEDGSIAIIMKAVESDGGRDTEKEIDEQDLLTGEPTGRKILAPATEFGERFYVRCEYPDGFSKTHQVKNTAELIALIVPTLRARYGVESVKTLEAPAIAVNAVIVMEVANGK